MLNYEPDVKKCKNCGCMLSAWRAVGGQVDPSSFTNYNYYQYNFLYITTSENPTVRMQYMMMTILNGLCLILSFSILSRFCVYYYFGVANLPALWFS